MSFKHRKRRGNSRNYFYVLFGLVVICIAGIGVYQFLLNVSWFSLKNVKISENKHIPSSLIHNIIKPHKNQNLFRIPVSELENKISSLHRVEKVKIKRRIPHSLSIIIKERQSLLYIKSLEGDLYPLDAEARVLESYSPYYQEDLPILSAYLNKDQLKPGTKLKQGYIRKAIAIHKRIVSELPEFEPRVSEYFFVGKTPYLVDTKYGSRIIPDPEDMITQLKRYMFVQENGAIEHDSIFDLRFKDQVVVKAGM
ncbi:MAG: FtsQ-type POTRA domain-containing protein [Candidatus Cloacimonetes bacterium]|nr:FtsQ-type POTRA domain-containing protein [Candidatus Cloacimonadota bacterium]